MIKRSRKFVRRNELLRKLLRGVYRSGKYNLARIVFKFRKKDIRMIYVDPNSIVNTISLDDITLTTSSVLHLGEISPGDFDLNGVPFHEYDHVYTILRQRLHERIPFEHIPEYNKNLNQIKNGDLIDSSTTPEEYLRRWQKIEDLYQSIKTNGYKTQTELGNKDSFDEVKVQIGRKGDLLFEEGIHRLTIAQLLNLDSIPVIVSRRHLAWQKLRQDILKIVLQRGFIHQPFNHPDLDNIPQEFGNRLKITAMYGNERWDYIRESLPITQGTVCDIGSYFGYFVHRFEDLGFECYAVEPDPENLAVLRRYRDMMEKKFTVWEKSIFDIEQFEFDIVLALNIFHHLIKTKRSYDELVTFLRNLNCRFMYFEPQKVSDGYQDFTDEEFVKFIIDNTPLTHATLLGHTREGRDLYLLASQ